MTKSLPENGNGALCESFKKLNGTLTREGRYFGQYFRDGNDLLRGNTDILIRDFGNAIFGEISKKPWRVATTVLMMVNILSSTSLIYVTPPCLYRDRSLNFLSILSTGKASQELIIRDLAHSILVRFSREK
jgi:hypothetical protein